MKVAILHQALAPDAGEDERDVLDQVAAVGGALAARGHDVVVRACDLDLGALERDLARLAPAVVFNLVESLAGRGSLVHLVPALLEARAIPYTGAHGEAMVLSSNKRLAKRVLADAGLPTPAPYSTAPENRRETRRFGSSDCGLCPPWGDDDGARYVVKSVWEHASVGLDAGSVVPAAAVPAARRERAARFGGEFFAERYVHGRELNVGLLDAPGGPEVLPIAEIAFEGFAPGEPRLLGYAAKWHEGSSECQRTPRIVPAEGPGDPLLEGLAALSRASWHAFGLGGYARVDFRVDDAGSPFILEVNANPCLSPDAGFAAALGRAGIAFEEAVARIVAAALAVR